MPETEIVPAPETSVKHAKRSRLALLGMLAIGLFGGILLTAGLAYLGITRATETWRHMLGRLTSRGTSIDISAPALIVRIQKLARLETVDYSIDKIVEGQREYALLPSFLTGDKLLLIAHGEVIAGVDLSQLKPSDLSVQGDSVTLRLPPAQILTSRLDNRQTRVYSRTTGLLVSADPNLESVVRLAAEQQLTQAAISQGILVKARQNAQASLIALLSGLGFRSVVVQ